MAQKKRPRILAPEEVTPPDKETVATGVRLVSPSQWQLEHGGESYEATARRRGWIDDDEW